MQFPLNPSVGSFTISSHLLFESLAFIIGYRYYLIKRNIVTDHISTENRTWIIIGAAAGAFLFSRLVGLFEEPEKIQSATLQALSNRTVVGGLLGGTWGVELVKWFLKEKQSSGDLFTLPIIFAMIIGRVGCFLAGLTDNTYGIKTTLPWGIDFGDGILRHPTNLYEILFLISLALFLNQLNKKFILNQGATFKIFIILYLLFRLLIDFIKPYSSIFANLSATQVMCCIGLIYYFKNILFPSRLFHHA